MLYYRRKILLAILDMFNGELSAKSLQKYLFLFTRKQENKAFEFIPFKYGCFSIQASQDIHTLEKYGYLTIVEKSDGTHISLNDKDKHYTELLDLFDLQILKNIKCEFGSLSQDELIRYTYIHYPFYATRSKIAEKLLSEEEMKLVDKQRRRINEKELFTIGYEGISIESYITKLILKDVRLLCDVRKNAYSQKFGFSKSQLQKACEYAGIKYIHIPELGINSCERQSLNTQEDYDTLFERYEKTTLIQNWSYLLSIKTLLDSNTRVALTCFEKNPAQCHRSRIAKQLMAIPDINCKFEAILNQ